MTDRLLDAIQAYKNLRVTGYFFALTYTKKSKPYYDANFLIRFDKECFRHLILGTKHLENDQYIEKNSKVLFDDLSNLTPDDCMNNKNYKTIVTDPNYRKITDRLENVINFDVLLRENNIKVYQRSQSNNVISKRIDFDFLLKLNKYDDHLDDPFLFIKREHENSVICSPVSTFRNIKNYEQNHNFRTILSLDITQKIYKKR